MVLLGDVDRDRKWHVGKHQNWRAHGDRLNSLEEAQDLARQTERMRRSHWLPARGFDRRVVGQGALVAACLDIRRSAPAAWAGGLGLDCRRTPLMKSSPFSRFPHP